MGKLVCMKHGFEFSEALSGWKQVGPTAKPLFNGIVVLDEDFDAVEALCLEEEKRRAEQERLQKSQRAVANWRRFVLSIQARDAASQHVESKWATNVRDAHVVQRTQPATAPRADEDILSIDSDVPPHDKSSSHPHSHHFPPELWIRDVTDPLGERWLKRCACGFSLPFERL